MARPDYKTPAGEADEKLIADIFALGKVGYVALERGGTVVMRHAPGGTADTSAESNFYEELLVNPTLLKLASQRGNLDCGGLDFIAIGYGQFTQLILLMKGGHISVGLSRNASTREMAGRVREVLGRNGVA